jgi:putative SOS response-associated peptidase YedK
VIFMCGRYALDVDVEDIMEAFPDIEVPAGLERRYNVAPTQDVAVVPNDGSRAVAMFRWGLVPAWADDPKIGNRMINARAETLAEKPSFRTALRKRRCLVLASGFYEWRAQPGTKTKTPHYIRLASGKPLAFAGLWETWKREGQSLRTFTIVTTRANELVSKLHDRMPVILLGGAHERWIDPAERPHAELADLLEPPPADALVAFPVSTAVNSPAHDAPDCLAPAS